MKDRFDAFPKRERVGAHRINPKLGSKFAGFLIAALATLLITALGILFINLQPGSVKYSTEVSVEGAVEDKPVAGVLDPEAGVVILNGTELESLAYFVDDFIHEEELGQVVFSGNADSNEVQTSAIFYSNPELESAAIALGEKLGGVKAYENTNFFSWGNDLAVLLGADYRGPGHDEALAGEHPRFGEGMSLNPEENFIQEEFQEEEYWG